VPALQNISSPVYCQQSLARNYQCLWQAKQTIVAIAHKHACQSMTVGGKIHRLNDADFLPHN